MIFFLVDKVALATQQAKFLQQTCPGKIGLLYGALGVDNFQPSQWAEIYRIYDVVVMTAAILKDCLARGLISISSISLLIFDECHHAQKAHPYAQIQEFYHASKPCQRPKIFGMTASPVGSHGRPDLVAAKLEMTLDARICVPDLISFASTVVRPKEFICFYQSRDSPDVAKTNLARVHELLLPFKVMHRSLKTVGDAGLTISPMLCLHFNHLQVIIWGSGLL